MISLLLIGGCGQSLPKMSVERDNYSTGGNLTFEYDETSRTAFFGQENEVVQYYEIDISKGFLKEGNRVGVKLTPNEEIKDLGSLTFKIGKEEIKGQDVATKINDKTAFFQLFPIIKNAGEKVEIGVEYKGQKCKYFVVVNEKAILMEKPADKNSE